MKTLILAISSLIISTAVYAAGLSPKELNVSGKEVSAKFDLSHLGEDCGLLVKWGDGNESKIRVGRDVNESDFTVTHTYSSNGPFIFEVEGKRIIRGLGSLFGCRADSFKQIVQLEEPDQAPANKGGVSEAAERETAEKIDSPLPTKLPEEKELQSAESIKIDMPEISLPRIDGDLIARDSRGPWQFESYCKKKILGSDTASYVFRLNGKPVKYLTEKAEGGCENGVATANWVMTDVRNQPYLFPSKSQGTKSVDGACAGTLKHPAFDPIRSSLNISTFKIHKVTGNLSLLMNETYISPEQFLPLIRLNDLINKCYQSTLDAVFYENPKAKSNWRRVARQSVSTMTRGTQKVILALVKEETTFGEANQALVDLSAAIEKDIYAEAAAQEKLDSQLAAARARANAEAQKARAINNAAYAAQQQQILNNTQKAFSNALGGGTITCKETVMSRYYSDMSGIKLRCQ